MFDTILKRAPWVVAAVMALTLTGQAAIAQSGDGVDPSAVANINADRVDGRHAVKSTGNVNLRKGRLMAFSAAGYLPSNIVLGGVATVAALQSTAGAVNEADNPVHWNQVQGVPPAVLAADTTRSFIAGESPVIAVAGLGTIFFDHPVGLEVETTLIPTAIGAVVIPGNNGGGDIPVIHQRLTADTIREFHLFQVFGVASTVKLRLTIWNEAYISPAAARNQVRVTFLENPKKALRELGLK